MDYGGKCTRHGRRLFGKEWGDFCLYHSRYLAKLGGMPYSQLCPADKLAVALEPWWFYLPRVILSGEVKEYMAIVETRHRGEPLSNETPRKWFKSVQVYLKKWAYEHRDMKVDTWTKL